MGLCAKFKQAFGDDVAVYWKVVEYDVNLSLGAVAVKTAAYASKEFADVQTAALKEQASANAEILAHQKVLDALRQEYNALPEAKRTESRKAYISKVVAVESAIKIAQAQIETIQVTIKDHAPGAQSDAINIPSGGVKIADDGSVSLADIYTWLKANVWKEATDA